MHIESTHIEENINNIIETIIENATNEQIEPEKSKNIADNEYIEEEYLVEMVLTAEVEEMLAEMIEINSLEKEMDRARL